MLNINGVKCIKLTIFTKYLLIRQLNNLNLQFNKGKIFNSCQ